MASGRILVVDDDVNACKALSRILSAEGYEVSFKLSPETALPLLGELTFAVVITDLKMKYMSGLAFIKEIKKIDPALPAIIVTGYADAEIIDNAITMDTFGRLLKPYKDNEMLELVAKAIEYSKIKHTEVVKKGKILVIDDETSICELLKKLLTSKGYEVIYKTLPDDVIETLKTQEFDVVISDIMMPHKSGVDLLKEIKQFDPILPVIIITAYPSDDTIDESMRSKAYDYIVKPFDAEKIYYVVDRAVSYHKLIKQSKNIKK